MYSSVSIRFWNNLSDLMYSWLGEAIAEDAEVVTASRRLARELRAAYDGQQLTLGRSAWRTPPVRSWHDWLDGLVSAVADPSAVAKKLDPVSSALLMEKCLRKQLPDSLPGVGGVIRQANQTWLRLCEWRVPLVELQSSARSHDEIAFAQAMQEYQQRLKEGGWVDSAAIAELAGELIGQKRVIVPDKVVLAGFDRLSPSAKFVVSALESAGCKVLVNGNRSSKINPRATSYDNPESELRAAGAWAREILDDVPDTKIAIVSPALENNAPVAARLVREGLAPGWQYGNRSHAAAANVSYGRKLAEYPLIAIALLLLRWTFEGLTGRELSLLLRSRCIAGPGTAGRSRLELFMRRFPDHLWSIDEFQRVFADKDVGNDAQLFVQGIATLADLSAGKTSIAAPSAWADRIDAALTAAHWPGVAALDSAEFQLLNRWRQLLNGFARLGSVLPQTDLADACQRIAALASDTVFQPESGQGLVQVLGTLEAAGMEFDAVWISGLDASQWPPASQPTLFVSPELQRKHGMPDATPGDTLQFAQRVLERLTSSATSCVLSWAHNREDSELTASSLIDRFVRENPSVRDPGWFARSLLGKNELEFAETDAAPAVTRDEKIRGGAYTVQSQYKEPFSAFVNGRLGVRPPDRIATGLSPSLRGSIVHTALHNLLADRPTQDGIAAWSSDQLDQRIGSAIDSALAEYFMDADPVMHRVLALERSRLRQLLQSFVTAELERPAFVIEAVEKDVEYHAFGIHLGLRIDRVDRLENGELLVIDYKTGQSKHFLDRSGKPTDLQLIVYADALDAAVGGLALINVDSRAIGYKGAGGDGGSWKAMDQRAWKETLEDWRKLVHKAMRDIAAGDVRINTLLTTGEGRPLSLLSRREEQKRAV